MTRQTRTTEVGMAAASKPHERKHRGRPELVEGPAGDARKELLRLGFVIKRTMGGRHRVSKTDVELARSVADIFGNLLYEDGQESQARPIPKGEADRMKKAEKKRIMAVLKKVDGLHRIEFSGIMDDDVRKFCAREAERILSAIPCEKQGVCYEELKMYGPAADAFARAAAQVEKKDPNRASALYERAGIDYVRYGNLEHALHAFKKTISLDPACACGIVLILRGLAEKPGEFRKGALLKMASGLEGQE